MQDANKALVRRFVEEAWNQGRLEAFDELVSRNCRPHDPVFPSLQPGAESLKRHITMCRNAFPDLTFRIDDVIAEGKEVVIHWTAQGTHRGQFLGMGPTNRAATATGTSIYRIENGKIAEVWVDWNLLTLLDQLGLAAAPAMAGQGSSEKQSRRQAE